MLVGLGYDPNFIKYYRLPVLWEGPPCNDGPVDALNYNQAEFIYMQFYQNICEVFNLVRSTTLFTNDKFTVTIAGSTSNKVEIDLSAFLSLSTGDPNLVSDPNGCNHILYEIYDILGFDPDATNKFVTCDDNSLSYFDQGLSNKCLRHDVTMTDL